MKGIKLPGTPIERVLTTALLLTGTTLLAGQCGGEGYRARFSDKISAAIDPSFVSEKDTAGR